VEEEPRSLAPPSMAESQLSELLNMRVLLEETRVISRSLPYHSRAEFEKCIGRSRRARPGDRRATCSPALGKH